MGPRVSRRRGVLLLTAPATAPGSWCSGSECLWGGGQEFHGPKCPFSLPFSLPSGDSSKKPTRECEPLSEPKVTPACLCLSLCQGLGAGAAAEHGASPPRWTFLPAQAHLGPPDPGRKRGASRGLDPTVGCACGLRLQVHGAPPGMPVNSPRS